jgi:NAD(P)H-dependent FMN reductase
MTHILVIQGSTRDGRFSDKVVNWVMHSLRSRPGVTLELADLRDHPLPFFDQDVPPSRTPREYRSGEIANFARTVDRADAFVVLTAEYNHGYPAVLKNALDHAFVEWNRKPIAFVGWGNAGGARAIEQLRMVSVELEMAPVRRAVHILADILIPLLRGEEEPATALATLDPQLNLLADDLLWWADALRAARRGDAVAA